MEELIENYKRKIAVLQRSQKHYERTGRGVMCVALQGKIQAYNAVIVDLNKLLKNN